MIHIIIQLTREIMSAADIDPEEPLALKAVAVKLLADANIANQLYLKAVAAKKLADANPTETEETKRSLTKLVYKLHFEYTAYKKFADQAAKDLQDFKEVHSSHL